MSTFAPPVHTGLKVLSKALFTKTIDNVAVRVPTKALGTLMKDMKKILLNRPRLSNIVSDGNSKETKLLLLANHITKDLENVPEPFKEQLMKYSLGVVSHKLVLDYDYWSADDILKAVLPTNEAPTGFEAVGHIAHLNLREEFLDYKSIIGQVILDKNPNLTSVVNKVDTIASQFRFFQMEVLAGEKNMIAELKEAGCKFKFDFSRVYWNSKLQTEHQRLVRIFEKGDFVCDVFAGVGPFALPASKKGCVVYANDLNPVSYQYLKENVESNKVSNLVHSYNLDGREFIKKAIRDLHEDRIAKASEAVTTVNVPKVAEPTKETSDSVALGKRKRVSVSKAKKQMAAIAADTSYKTFQHFVMNLPGTAIEFLDAFRGSYSPLKEYFEKKTGVSEAVQMPMVHCHCFTTVHDDEEIMKMDVVKRASESLKYELDAAQCTVHNVRSVAPRKDMMCISFRLPEEVAYNKES